ncbi:MAG TPA: PQQ-binding-like beta-propeller repeat protein, partial [Vicinamibacteria bacterium]|nr:PQQ-binding-like beta-propeller repeat protein [Vicinamibacteria bacterium]
MRRVFLPIALIAVFLGSQGSRPVGSQSPDRGLFGDFPTRNSVSAEKGLPSTWDADTGTNILWSQPAGSQSYAGPVVAGGRVFIGTNNEGNRNPAIKGDRGVVMAFDASKGDFLWQMATPKLPSGRVNDW